MACPHDEPDDPVETWQWIGLILVMGVLIAVWLHDFLIWLTK